MADNDKIQKLLWSIALPGFGQLLNRKYVKGAILIALELLINGKSHLNEVIQLSFQGNIIEAIASTNYQWLMFYPCVYMFSIWDAYRDAAGQTERLEYLPYITSAYMATVGMIYSPKFKIMSVLLGPVWATILFCMLGLLGGLGLKYLIVSRNKKE